MKRFIPAIIALGLALLPGCDTTSPTQATNPTPSATVTPTPTPTPEGFTLTSSAFQNGGAIPLRFGYEQGNTSIPLHWGTPPTGTKSLALLMTDKTFGGNYVHWAVVDIPATVRDLAEGIASTQNMPGKMLEASGPVGTGYEGPWPPGEPHDYTIELYALDVEQLPFTTGENGSYATADLKAALTSHKLDKVELQGTFTPPEPFVLTSSGFANGTDIPEKYASLLADGQHDGYLNKSVPLHWGVAPAGVKSFALLMDDVTLLNATPSRPTVHWAVIDIPATTRDIPEGASKTASMPGTELSIFYAADRMSSATGYTGPLPPPAELHQYRIRLYALDVEHLDLVQTDQPQGGYTLDSFNAQVAAHAFGSPITLYGNFTRSN